MQCISCTRASSSTKYSLMNFGNNSFMNHFRIHALNVHFGFVQLVLHNFLQIKYSNWQTFKMSYLKFCSQLGQVTFSQSKPSSTIYNTSLKKFANNIFYSELTLNIRKPENHIVIQLCDYYTLLVFAFLLLTVIL